VAERCPFTASTPQLIGYRSGSVLRRLPSRRDAAGSDGSRAEPRRQGPRPLAPAQVPRLRKERAGGGLDQVVGTGRVNGAALLGARGRWHAVTCLAISDPV